MFTNIFIQRFLDSLDIHITAVKGVFRYLNGRNYCLMFDANKSLQPEEFADADYSNDVKTRCSTSVRMCDGAVSWKSKIQQRVSQSTTEAECYAGVFVIFLYTCYKLISTLNSISFSTIISKLFSPKNIESIEKCRIKHLEVKYHFRRTLYRPEIFLRGP